MSSRHGAKRHLLWFFLGVLFTSAAFIFLPHYAHSVGDRQAIARKMPGIPSLSSTVEQSTQFLPTALSSRFSGFVLQVAAMKHEDNAHALAETLHQMNFPAFVFKRGGGPFYRVAVGVYGNADSAVRVKDELERKGFEAILRPWLPE
jgi:cell division septation protein DedD